MSNSELKMTRTELKMTTKNNTIVDNENDKNNTLCIALLSISMIPHAHIHMKFFYASFFYTKASNLFLEV